MHTQTGLIGSSGFVGLNLQGQAQFDLQYGRSTISELSGKHFSVLVCAAPSAVKWKANQNPEADKAEVESLITSLSTVTADYFVLISTVDVYPVPVGVDEHTVLDPEIGDAYGHNRLLLSKYVEEHFSHHLILRLPGLFGTGLKKNVIFDLLHTGESPWTDADSAFQFYDISHLWKDIEIAKNQGISLLNVATEPISVRELAAECFGLTFTNKTEKPSVHYDIRSIHAASFQGKNGYLYTKQQVLADLKSFVTAEKASI